MNKSMLSDSEKEILEWMWEEDKEYSYRDLAAQFGETSKKGWKKQTLSTFLTRMEQKGVISVRYEGEECFHKKRYFTAVLNRQQYEKERAKMILDSYFDGSLHRFMAALIGGGKLEKKDADELRSFLEDRSC